MSRTVTVNIDVSADADGVTRLNRKVADLDENTKKAENTARSGFKGMGGAADVFLGEMAVEAVTRTIGQLKKLATQAIQTGARFEQSMADLEAITGLADDKLQQLSQSARESSVETGSSASEIVQAYKRVASNIEGAAGQSVPALQRIGRQSVTLSQAAGTKLNKSVDTVVNTMNQFGVEADESGRVVNTLAAGAKEGAAEVDMLSQSLNRTGTAAAGADVSLESTVGAIEVLAQNGLKGAESGTQLRNVLTILQTESEKLAKHGIKNVNLQQDGLIKTLQKLRPLMDDASARTEIFGRENQQAASLLIQNAEGVQKMTQAVTDTNTAQQQAAKQMSTFQGVMEKLGTTLDQLEIAFFKAVGPELKQLIREAIESVMGFRDEFRTFLEVLVNATGPALGIIEEAFAVVFENIGDILFNTITGIPKLIGIAMRTSAENIGAVMDYVSRQISRVGERAKALGNLLIGALSFDRQQFKEGLDGLQKELVKEGEGFVQLAKDLGSNWGEAFRETAETMFAGIDTSALDRKIRQAEQAIQNAGTGGVGGGQQGSTGESMTPQQAANQSATPAEVKQNQMIEQSERSLANTVKQASLQRMSMATKEAAARAKAAQKQEKAAEGVKKAEKERLAQTIAAGTRSAQSAQDVAQTVIGSIKKQVQAYIAKTVASAVSSLGPAAPFLGPALGASIFALFNSLLSGLIPGYARGGEIEGPGGPEDDQVLIRASDQEYVINAESAQAAPGLVRRINADPQVAEELERAVVRDNTVQRDRQVRQESVVVPAPGVVRSEPSGTVPDAPPEPSAPSSEPLTRREVRQTRTIRVEEQPEPETASADTVRSPARRRAGGSDPRVQEQLAGVEAAVREQTERLEDIDRAPVIDPYRFGEEMADFDAFTQ